jgi:hypothetical protein
MDNSNPVNIPMDPNIKLEPNTEQATKEQINWFQTVIGSLLYLTFATRPDLAYSVIKLARFATNPSLVHISAIKKVLRYLKGTRDLGIIYSNKNINSKYLSGYCDADYAGDIASAKSTSGFIFYLACGLISWKSKLQSIIAQSTTEAEYIAINAALKEAIYIIGLLKELNLYNQEKLPLYTDNNGALLLAKNPVFHERTKHIAVKYHYIRDMINKGIIELIYIPTEKQRADGFTKPLSRVKFNRFIDFISLA